MLKEVSSLKFEVSSRGACYAKQSQSPEEDKGGTPSPRNALRRHYERGLSRKTKPIGPAGQMVGIAHPAKLPCETKPTVDGWISIKPFAGKELWSMA